MLDELMSRFQNGRGLAREEISGVLDALLSESVTPENKAAFLGALHTKGETADEIAGFAQAILERANPLPLSEKARQEPLLDVCGTGGDHLGTFNISTAVAIVCAAAGVRVAKHGNRAITSKSGSADVLEALGIPIDLSPSAAAERLEKQRFAFLFAPLYHPAFKALGPARKLCAERGQRTLFNFLGPLLNPARPDVQLVGVSRPDLVEILAQTLQMLGVRRAMVVCGSVPNGGILDELSTLGSNQIAEFYQGRALHSSTWAPTDLPLRPATLDDLKGGNSAVNARIIEAILNHKDQGPRRDAVLLNAGAALFLSGEARSIADGWTRAQSVLESGIAAKKLEALRGGQ